MSSISRRQLARRQVGHARALLRFAVVLAVVALGVAAFLVGRGTI